MSNKILIAVDPSENALKAVKYAAGILRSDSQVTLYHVFFKTPPLDLREGEILPHHPASFSGSTKVLIKGGLDPKNIEVKIEEGKQGVATDILNEVKKGG